MTKQGNIMRDRSEEIRPTTLAASLTMTVAFIAMICLGMSMNEHSVYAQMMGDHGGFGNKTSGPHEGQ
jgi:hypothetical protein